MHQEQQKVNKNEIRPYDVRQATPKSAKLPLAGKFRLVMDHGNENVFKEGGVGGVF